LGLHPLKIERSYHYYSEEFSIEGLPSKINIPQALDIQTLKDKAAAIRFENPIFGRTEFVIVIKGSDTLSDLRNGKDVGVYLFHHDERVRGQTLDLSGGRNNCLDWGAITVSAKTAADRQALQDQAALNHHGPGYKKL
jgi:hypothetical protein